MHLAGLRSSRNISWGIFLDESPRNVPRGERRGEGGMKYKGQQVKDVSRWCVASYGMVNCQKVEIEELAAISTNVMLTQLMLR